MLKLYKDWLRIIIKKPMNIFWVLFFPIILVTLFKLTMGNVDTVSEFSEKIKLEFVKTGEETLETQIESTFDSEELKKYCEFTVSDSKEVSQEKIENKDINGYFYVEPREDGQYTLIVKTGHGSFANSMITNFLEQYVNTANKVYKSMTSATTDNNKDFIKADYTKSGEEVYKSEKVQSVAALYTFPAIVYSILFTGLIVQDVIRSMSSNMSYTGMRVELGNQRKSKVFISAILATFTVGLVCLIFITLYIQILMKIEVGLTTHFGYLMLIYVVGLIVSILLASMVVMLTHKKSKETQNSILTTILMLMYFCSGGMVGNISLEIKHAFMPLYYLNPASLLSDSIQYLGYKDDLSVVFRNLLIVALSGIVYLVVSLIALRRKKNELY